MLNPHEITHVRCFKFHITFTKNLTQKKTFEDIF